MTALVAMEVALTFLPAMLALTGGLLATRPERARGRGTGAALARRVRLARAATARPATVVVALVCIGVLVVAASGLSRLSLSFSVTGDLPSRAEVARASAAAAKGFAPRRGADRGARPGVRTGSAPARAGPPAHAARGASPRRRSAGPRQRAGQAAARRAVARSGAAARYAVLLDVDPLGA